MPPTHQVVKARAMRDVVAAIPFQCGFHPRRSIVVVSLRGPRRRIGQVTRVDLPAPDEVADMAADLASFVRRDQALASLVLVYDDQPWVPEAPPHRAAVRAVVDQLGRLGSPAIDAVYVGPERYWSYECRNPGCCPPEGALTADAMNSPIAAAYVLSGLAPLASREALAARVQPSRPLLVAAVADSTWRWLGAFAAESDADVARGRPDVEARPDRQWAAAAGDLMVELLAAYRRHAEPIGTDQAGQLVAVLQDITIRDEIMLRFCRTGLPQPEVGEVDEAGPGPDLETDLEMEDAVERLLLDLCVRVEGPFASAPLSLLGWHSWARGEGALARIAVDRALAEDPAYRLAVLLSAVLDNGLSPDWVATMRHDDEQAS